MMMGKFSVLAILLVCGVCAAQAEQKHLTYLSWHQRNIYSNMGICWIMGNPHYRTFDSHYYNFMGNCTYIMASSKCSDGGNMPFFEVEVQNENHLQSEIPDVEMVVIKVYEFTFTIYRTEYGIVRYEDNLWNLPLYLGDGRVSLAQSGTSLLLLTEFGLSVQYDWQQYLVIMLPDKFKGKTCGLCGNFNGKDSDDKLLPNGSPADSIKALGKSWRVPGAAGDANCQDDCDSQCEHCEHTSVLEHVTGKVFCTLMTQVMTGPLSGCSAIIPKNVYSDYCNYDVCMGKSMKKFICDNLHVYTDACQRAGVKVLNWRGLAGCPDIQCPKNSHYEHCGSSCPATCDNPKAPSDCGDRCVEGCVCDDGFVLRGNECVLQSHCGCLYEKTGSYVQAGKTFWTENCQKLCTCDPSNGGLVCKSDGCSDGEECQVVKGIRGCYATSRGICTIAGDPHYKTFDNLFYSFQGNCTYTAAKALHIEGTRLHPFTVVVENEKWMNTELTAANAVAVEVYGQTLVLRKNQIGVVMVDGVLMHLPVNLNNGQVEVFQDGTYDVIKTDFGLTVTYDLVYHVTIIVPGSYHGKTGGLCGNFNGNKQDEYMLPDGKVTKSIKDFGGAWKESVHGMVCDDGCTGDHCPKCAEDKKHIYEADCSVIKNPNGPFGACLSVIDPESYFRDCVYDVCMGNGDRNMLCHSIAAYVTDCQHFGVDIHNWRSPSLCPMSCPTNSHYQICGQTCQSPCPGLTGIVRCPKSCTEGCACNSGYYFNGAGCVKLDECNCYYDGRTYKVGDSGINWDCSELITCQSSAVVKRESMHCKSGEVCKVKNGVRGCFTSGCIYDGHTYQSGESVVNHDCTERTTCGLSGIQHEPIHCKSDEICMIKYGTRGCFSPPSCVYDGHTYQMGETVVNEDCTERFTCQPLGMHHEHINCNSDEVCKVKNGVRGCFSPTSCIYNGRTYRVGESVINRDCTERITCQASGSMQHEPISCRSNEVCRVKDGARGCFTPTICHYNGRAFENGEIIVNEDCSERITCQVSGIVKHESFNCKSNEICLIKYGVRGCFTISGCVYEGHTYKMGESVVNKDCTERITCQLSGSMQHEPIYCRSDEVCRVKDGARGCFTPTICHYNGHTYKVGESVVNEDCTERNTCQPSGSMQHEPISCRSGEVCRVKGGARGCFTPTKCNYNGRTFENGETVVNEDCTERITCQPSGNMHHERIQCKSDEICMIKYGVRACFSPPKCVYGTHTYKNGESVINEDCTERITCQPSGSMQHERISCKSDQVCRVKNGVRGCFTPTHCTYNGRTFENGETIVNEDCSEHIICQASGIVQHKPFNCKSNEICMIKSGVRGCFTLPECVYEGHTYKSAESVVNEDCTERLTCQASGSMLHRPIHCKSDEICIIKYGVRGCFFPPSCVYDGHTYRMGESVVNGDCTERITCPHSGIVQHERISCKSDEVCKVKDGVRGCFTPTNCYYDGSRYRVGESVINEDCTERITCQASGSMHHERIYCKSDQVCRLNNGVRGCFTPTHCIYNGRTYENGETVVNEDCTEQNICQPSGSMRHEPISCKSDQVCRVKNGVRGCFTPTHCIYNGHTFENGETIVTEDCSERITCQVSGIVRHEPFNCKSNEICLIKYGVRGCFKIPGCVYEGHTYQVGETVVTDGCTERLTCQPSGSMLRQPIHCRSDEVCKVKDGVRGCFTPTNCHYNGHTYKIGESVINEYCTERITCQPSGSMHHQPIHCGSDEVCKVKDGVRGCFTPSYCHYNGHTYKVGETLMNKDCTERIYCQASGRVHIERMSCHGGEVCMVKNGVLGCFTPTSCDYNGHTYKIGESVVNEDCTERITCQASGRVHREVIHCKSDEVCMVKYGVRKCYHNVDQCTITASAALTMFSGSGSNIDITGAFDIVKVCDGAMVKEWFRVVVKLQECGHVGLRRVEAVYVFFDTMVITVNAKHQTWVNGRRVNLPSLLKNEISVKISEDMVVIEKMSALRVTYSVTQEINVTVSDHFADKVCGACGKIAGDASISVDTKNIRKWMDSWRSPDFPTCEQ